MLLYFMGDEAEDILNASTLTADENSATLQLKTVLITILWESITSFLRELSLIENVPNMSKCLGCGRIPSHGWKECQGCGM